ncbi:MerR family transcriptional regulator [Peribacillus frigoritolerans]|uniref:MerR family transcriptional regulator n=1 Tax=Peribacillus frigoritolerans TaxID=450367 RepID=UPI002B2497DB|nr:MerR family transcriptional regulator [Peribacillus frigoritolerans]MEB2631966.1 MerR family transcriptional regulator [Peribacillus frigoritolerans]
MYKSEKPSDEKQGEDLDKGFTVKEVASFIDETPNVIRNWFKELRQYIPHEKSDKGNGYNIYKREGIDRFKEIQALHREQNWSMKQIEHYFATGGESFKPEPEKKAGEMIAEELKAMREELVALREENKEIKIHLENQENFNKALVEQLQKFERGSVERDDQLTKAIKEAKEQKKLIAVSNEDPDTNLDKHKKGFFARLIGK